VDEAIMLNTDGYVAEATANNIFIARDATLFTPPTSAGILEGVTRRLVMELARKRNYPTREINLVRHDIYIADECFLTGSATEIIPVVSLDKRVIGSGSPGPITRTLMSEFVAYRNRLSE
jgi:branched-chain amino acid aminotransferase